VKSGIRMIGYTRDSMGLDRDTVVKDKSEIVPGHIEIFGRGSRYRCDYNRLF
jgi:hypothetical protein